MAQASSSRSRRFGLAALALATILPSGPAGAEPGPDDMTSARSPALVLAQAAPAPVGPMSYLWDGDTLQIGGDLVSKGGEFTSEGTIRVYGDINGTGTQIQLNAPNIEVIGTVNGHNIVLNARAAEDLRETDINEINTHSGRIKIHGDVDVIDGRIGTFGTGHIDILGNARMRGSSHGSAPLGSALTGQDVCIAGGFHSDMEYAGRNMISADNLRVGTGISGFNLTTGIYNIRDTIAAIRENGGRVPSFNGKTLIGGGVYGSDMTISNGEVSIEGPVVGEGIEITTQRPGQRVVPADLRCGEPPAFADQSDAAKPAPVRGFG
ncbi:MAG: hypothetical protein CL558_01130 [Alphaproteobacteria bacterium]|nr:hypothetical protein [Alphaproteobacteria bacterium]MAS47534.1 hypothetical protein [Alphaproteobacteria bacterium]MAX96593.1 hypothetical protein [Alphaproteobacteria bacterium]MBN52158.1 hypothetical protein [Alphaproteobacteria bacterium]OUT40979.1 MAG: hypothetical protein CBB62_00995 [Micavibrio sp. TMED2]|tara:strand:- start:11113 stop:12078 length:966 start_codon:yes stop_codon:yes gene_type:complete